MKPPRPPLHEPLPEVRPLAAPARSRWNNRRLPRNARELAERLDPQDRDDANADPWTAGFAAGLREGAMMLEDPDIVAAIRDAQDGSR